MIRENGVPWFDIDGRPIHAHGGNIIKIQDTYYWYGEDRRENYYVSCYSSKNLMDWKFKKHILTTNSRVKEIYDNVDIKLTINGDKINIERPKVIYNNNTGKFIMLAHYENGKDYKDAKMAVATCDTPDGDFVYHGSFNPLGHMSRDCTVFINKEEKAFFISAANNNKDLHIYSLNDDYLSIKKLENIVFMDKYREAPALFTYQNRIFMITSYCTGWCPNQCGYSSSSAVSENWTTIEKCGDETTYHSQPAWILNLQVKGKNQCIYIGDRWGGNQWDGIDDSRFGYENSTYYFSLIEVNKNNKIVLKRCNKYSIDEDNGFSIIE